jgi:hypothetical protein
MEADLRVTAQTWLEDLDTQTKLLVMEADLRATAQFIASADPPFGKRVSFE